MSDNTALGDRMKGYEAVTKGFLPRRTYTIIRVDGKAFRTFLREADKPFDPQVMELMDATAEALCREVAGTAFAYTQSDEISLLLQDFSSVHTEAWFGGNVQKMASVAAATATAWFNWDVERYRMTLGLKVPSGPAMFDARVFTIPDPVEVANYFLWRQRDAVRNSVSMAAQANFSHKSLQGLNSSELQEKLFTEKGINWSEYPARVKRGGICVKETFQMEPERMGDDIIIPVRTKWEARGAPHFTALPGDFLSGIIPERMSHREIA